jgi:hypothetical protein
MWPFEENNEKERIQDVDWDLSSNIVPSLLEVLKDNHLELLASTHDLCVMIDDNKSFRIRECIYPSEWDVCTQQKK